MPSMPSPRGELSAGLIEGLCHEAHDLEIGLTWTPDPLTDEDLQLALYLCYELHYRGLAGVDERWEWSPALLRLRAELERRFELALHEAVPYDALGVPAEEIDLALRAIADQDTPPLSSYIRSKADVDQVREFLVHRSAYQLKEADPHSWAIPRLSGRPKAAMIEIQADEYGGGRADWIHAELFARSMQALGLKRSYGAYLDVIPGVTLATVNLMSLFGLHRRMRGAIVGHLALFEMTSSIPNRRYGDGLRRLGFEGDATLFFDEHVEADAVHENVAAVDLAGGLVRQEPDTCASVLWGARALAHLDAAWAGHVLGCWRERSTSLLRELDESDLAPAREALASH
ncbi:MAG: iron-containing redox enzyme family protein [Solirubrobacterales bacterium]|nr:iron-containing redox enzyme family protein [Solirubrobacterales bacterium]